MESIKLTVVSDEFGATENVPGYKDEDQFPCLAVRRVDPSSRHSRWVVNHINSGRKFPCKYKTRKEAMRAAEKFCEKWDWDFGNIDMNWDDWEWEVKNLGKIILNTARMCGGR